MLSENDRTEIQNHSYSFHSIGKRKGSGKTDGESEEEYKKIFMTDILKLQNKIYEKTGRKPEAYTYPYGMISKNSEKYLKQMKFSASYSCEEGLNYITHDKDCLYKLKRFLRSNDRSVQTILEHSF